MIFVNAIQSFGPITADSGYSLFGSKDKS